MVDSCTHSQHIVQTFTRVIQDLNGNNNILSVRSEIEGIKV